MNDSTLLLDIGQSAGNLPNTTPVPVRYGSWFPVPHNAAPIAPVENGNATPVADGMLLEWNPSDHPDVQYRIERAPNASGPWTLMGYTQEPRYRVSDPSGATWHYRITPIIRGRAGASITVEGASKQAPDIQDLIAQQTALDNEILARAQGDFQTALAAAADAEIKANAALTTATGHTEARVAQAEAASVAGDAALAQSLQAVQATVNGKADASVVQMMQVKVSGLETHAAYTMAVNVNGHVSGLRVYSDGTVSDITMLADIFRILSPLGAPNGLELQNGTLRVWRDNAQRIIGNGFGPNADLMDYFGPNVGTANASKSNNGYGGQCRI